MKATNKHSQTSSVSTMHRQFSDSLTFPLLIVSILRSYKSRAAISIGVISHLGTLTDLQQIYKDPAIKEHTFPNLLRRIHELSSEHRSKSTNDATALLSFLSATATIVKKVQPEVRKVQPKVRKVQPVQLSFLYAFADDLPCEFFLLIISPLFLSTRLGGKDRF